MSNQKALRAWQGFFLCVRKDITRYRYCIKTLQNNLKYSQTHKPHQYRGFICYAEEVAYGESLALMPVEDWREQMFRQAMTWRGKEARQTLRGILYTYDGAYFGRMMSEENRTHVEWLIVFNGICVFVILLNMIFTIVKTLVR